MPKQRIRSNGKQGTPVLDAFSEFIASRQAANVTKSTLQYYHRKLRPFCQWCVANGVPTVTDIANRHPRDYILTLQARNLSPFTQHGVARAIRAFVRFCHAEGMIDAAPKITMPKLPKELPQPFTQDEIARIGFACDCARDRAIILFLTDTGLRASEFVALDGRDLDVDEGAVFVRAGKGQKDRFVYFGGKTRQAILRYWREQGKPGNDDPMWVSLVTGGRLTDWGLSQALRRLGKRAGVLPCSPHRFRRTFAVWSLRAGLDVFTLQRLLGHEDLTTTRQYLALVEDDLRDAHRKHGPVDSML